MSDYVIASVLYQGCSDHIVEYANTRVHMNTLQQITCLRVLNTKYSSDEFERIRENSKLSAHWFFRVASGFICLKLLSIVNKYG